MSIRNDEWSIVKNELTDSQSYRVAMVAQEKCKTHFVLVRILITMKNIL